MAVCHIHRLGIAHRDLKLDNLLLTKDKRIKIVDFGISKKLRTNAKFKEIAGTPLYTAPEVIDKSYDLQCDMWSIGVIVYLMASGFAPF